MTESSNEMYLLSRLVSRGRSVLRGRLEPRGRLVLRGRTSTLDLRFGHDHIELFSKEVLNL